MSKFYGNDTSSSSESEKEEIEEGFTGPSGPSFQVSDDEEDIKRVVRSAKEKKYEQLHDLIKSIRNSKKIKDFYKMETTFKELCTAHEKAKAVIAKEESGITPKFYIRILVEMEDLVNAAWEDTDARKKMNKNNGKSLGALRQKLRKYIKIEFESEVVKYRENPDEIDGIDLVEQEEEDTDSDSTTYENGEAKVFENVQKFKKEGKKLSEDEDDSDDSYWDNMSESSSESSSDGEGQRDWRKHFMKKDVGDDKLKKDKREKKAQRVKAVKEVDDDGDWTKVERTIEKPKLFEKGTEINYNVVITKLNEMMGVRGRKRTNEKVQIQLLSELLNVSNEKNLGIGVATKIQFAIIATIFDCNALVSGAMKPDIWESCMIAVGDLLRLIEENYNTLKTGENINEEIESLEHPPYKVRGCFLSCVERMDEEFLKVLKDADQHSSEYIDRLKDESRVLEILERAQNIIDISKCSPSEICRLYMKKIEHIYFKFDARVIDQKNGKIPQNEITSLQMIENFCKFIYGSDYSRLRTQAILSHIYFLAIHDNWYESRDLMLMSHLQDSIMHSDPSTQILYNRTMVQLGLCAFRQGEINDAHNALLDFVASRRSKELLGQGMIPQRQYEEKNDQEKIEKQRQLPFHMHINLELMECVYLVSAMLIEIPYMAAHEYNAKRRMISKPFFQQLRSSERQSLIGPPESMREHVIAASKAMRVGDWRKCRDFIINEKMNTKVWNLFHEPEIVRNMLISKIQTESLRTYLFAYSKVYDSISQETLSEMYELGKESVHAIVSKMAINGEIMAKLDEPTQCMVMDKTEPSRLQSMALQLAHKLTQLSDSNQKLMDLTPGQSRPQRWQGGEKNNRFQIPREEFNRFRR